MIAAGEGNCELREKMVVATAGVNGIGWGGGGTRVWLEGGGRWGTVREGGGGGRWGTVGEGGGGGEMGDGWGGRRGQRVWEAAVAKTMGEASALLPLSLFLVDNG